MLSVSGVGVHVLARVRRAAPPDDILYKSGWREVTGALTAHAVFANLALALAVVAVVLVVRAKEPRHPAEVTAMKAVVVSSLIAFPAALPGAARALQRRLERDAPSGAHMRSARLAAMVSIVGLLLSAIALRAEAHTTWMGGVYEQWPPAARDFWLAHWPDQLKLPVLAQGRPWYIPVCVIGTLLLIVLLRRSYEPTSLLERRLFGVAVAASAVYWIPVLPLVVLTPHAVTIAALLAVLAMVGCFVADLVAGPPENAPQP